MSPDTAGRSAFHDPMTMNYKIGYTPEDIATALQERGTDYTWYWDEEARHDFFRDGDEFLIVTTPRNIDQPATTRRIKPRSATI